MLSNQRQPYQTTRQSNRSRAQDPVWVKVKFASLFVYVEAFTKTQIFSWLNNAFSQGRNCLWVAKSTVQKMSVNIKGK